MSSSQLQRRGKWLIVAAGVTLAAGASFLWFDTGPPGDERSPEQIPRREALLAEHKRLAAAASASAPEERLRLPAAGLVAARERPRGGAGPATRPPMLFLEIHKSAEPQEYIVRPSVVLDLDGIAPGLRAGNGGG